MPVDSVESRGREGRNDGEYRYDFTASNIDDDSDDDHENQRELKWLRSSSTIEEKQLKKEANIYYFGW